MKTFMWEWLKMFVTIAVVCGVFMGGVFMLIWFVALLSQFLSFGHYVFFALVMLVVTTTVCTVIQSVDDRRGKP